jgi:transcriptional regulator with AAA-type ATPase domain
MDSLKTMIIIINNFFANSKNLFFKTKKWTPTKTKQKNSFLQVHKMDFLLVLFLVLWVHMKTKKWTPWKETKKLQFFDLQKWSKLMNKKMMNKVMSRKMISKVMRRKKTFTKRRLPSPWPPLDSPQPSPQ